MDRKKKPRRPVLKAIARRFIDRYGGQTRPTMYSILIGYVALFGMDDDDLTEGEAGRYLALMHGDWDWTPHARDAEPALYKATVTWAKAEME